MYKTFDNLKNDFKKFLPKSKLEPLAQSQNDEISIIASEILLIYEEIFK